MNNFGLLKMLKISIVSKVLVLLSGILVSYYHVITLMCTHVSHTSLLKTMDVTLSLIKMVKAIALKFEILFLIMRHMPG